MKKTHVFHFLRNALWILSCIVAISLFAMNFIFTADVTYDDWEQVTIYNHLQPSLIMLLVAALLIFACSFIKNIAHKIDEKKLFFGLSVFYTLMALYLILNVDHSLVADSNTVFQAAQNTLDGNYSDFALDGYIHRYPHQLGLMLYDTILALFSRSSATNFLVNFFFVLGINYYTYKIADHLFGNRSVNLLTMLACFAFLPQLLYILFAYGLTPGFFFMILAFYSALKFADEYKLRYLPGLVLGSVCAVLLKNNYMIGVIAIIIFLILKLLKNKFSWKSPVALVLLILSLFLPHRILASTYEQITGGDLDNGTPAILWLAMGTDLDNHMRTSGWYDGTNYTIYTDSYYNEKYAQIMGEAKMKENIAKIQENPQKAFYFFLEKNVSQWCEPMYQSVFISRKSAEITQNYPELLQSLYNADTVDDLITNLSKFLTLMIYGFAAVFFIFYRKKCFGWEMLISFTIGGLIFHTFWEGKSQYIYPYLFVLIPLAMYALWQVITKIKGLMKKRHE